MCEIMTIVAALAFTVVYFADKRRGIASSAVFTTMMMFWGAALMWGVDCIANKMDGEEFFDISQKDAALGGIILAAGLLVFAGLSLVGRRQPQV